MKALQVLKSLPSKLRKVVTMAITITSLFVASSANATLIDLNMDAAPDIFSSFISVNYDLGTETLSADGFAMNYFDGVMANAITGGAFSLTAAIDAAGVMTSGSFSITGTIASLGFNSNVLLSGMISDFGFSDTGGDPLEFMLDITGGDLASAYGTSGGIILSGTGFNSNLFTQNFSSSPFGAVSDTGVVSSEVPEPSSALLLAFALVTLSLKKRRFS